MKTKPRQQLIRQAEEELWSKIVDMAITEELTTAEWLEIIDLIRCRVLLRQLEGLEDTD